MIMKLWGRFVEIPLFKLLGKPLRCSQLVYTWQTDLLTAGGPRTIHGDAQGVLQAVVAQRARNPLLNLIVAEIQVVLGPTANSITAVHLWSEENQTCDALSRLHEGSCVPDELRTAVCCPPPPAATPLDRFSKRDDIAQNC